MGQKDACAASNQLLRHRLWLRMVREALHTRILFDDRVAEVRLQ